MEFNRILERIVMFEGKKCIGGVCWSLMILVEEVPGTG